MKTEILSVANFLTNFVKLASEDSKTLSEWKLTEYRQALICVMKWQYSNHWDKKNPTKYSSYRMIQNNNKGLDPIIKKAGEKVFFSDHFLNKVYNFELIMWIDPHHVQYSINAKSPVILYDNSISNPAYSTKFYDEKPWIAHNDPKTVSTSSKPQVNIDKNSQKPSVFEAFKDLFFKHNPTL